MADEPTTTIEETRLLLPLNEQEQNHDEEQQQQEEERAMRTRVNYSSCCSSSSYSSCVTSSTTSIRGRTQAIVTQECEHRPIKESSTTTSLSMIFDSYLRPSTTSPNSTHSSSSITNNTSTSFSSSSKLQKDSVLSNYYCSWVYRPFLDTTGNKRSICMGLTLLSVLGIFLGIIMPKNQVLPTPSYRYISSIIGYTYFIFWCFSFYPQVISNHVRKSVEGLSVDFTVINFVGYVCYALYTSLLYWNPGIQKMYQERHMQQPQKQPQKQEYDNAAGDTNETSHVDNGAKITVQSNDVAFALHAVVLSGIWIYQLYHYGSLSCRNGKSSLGKTFAILIGCILSLIMIYSILVWNVSSLKEEGTSTKKNSNMDHDWKDVQVLFMNKDGGMIMDHWLMKYLNWLDFIYFLSLVKVFITLLKYIPQVILNAR
jgi:cystinosin